MIHNTIVYTCIGTVCDELAYLLFVSLLFVCLVFVVVSDKNISQFFFLPDKRLYEDFLVADKAIQKT
jgi:hypothetical protein